MDVSVPAADYWRQFMRAYGKTRNQSQRALRSRASASYRWPWLVFAAIFAAGLAAAVPQASAQVQPASAQVPAVYGPGFLPYGYGYGGGRYGGRGYGGRMPGTAFSAAAFGMARVIAARGYANLMNSRATQNYLAARSQDFKNRVQWTNSYYAMRREHRGYDESQGRLSLDDLTRIAENAAPKRLDAKEFEAGTGKVRWPVILQDAKYIEACDELENLFQSRARASGTVSAETYRDINQACDRLLKLLKSNITEYQPNDFESTKHFIEGLRREAQAPAT
jgi:hypothetical protein